MEQEERTATIRNVISDLEAIYEQMCEHGTDKDSLWLDAKLAVEHIETDTPHL